VKMTRRTFLTTSGMVGVGSLGFNLSPAAANSSGKTAANPEPKNHDHDLPLLCRGLRITRDDGKQER